MYQHHGRHAPSYVLLYLMDGPAYGLDLLNQMQKDIPFCTIDSAAIYRALSRLKKEGYVRSHWVTDAPGPAKKVFTITEQGIQYLKECYTEIQKYQDNLSHFIEKYRQYEKTEDE